MLEMLNYPFDNNILVKKKKLKKLLLKKSKFLEKNIAILGGSTTSEVRNILELFLLKNGIKPNFYESEYNKFYEDALFGSDALEAFKPDVIYIHTSNVNVIKYPEISHTRQDIDTLLENECNRFEQVWSGLQKYSCAIIQNNFELPLERNLGNLDFYNEHGKVNFIHRLNQKFSVSAEKIKNLYINDINYQSSLLGLEKWYSREYWYGYKYALSFDAIPLVAHNVAQIINAIFGQSKKCLVLDLDNTCWGGVIGDDGLNGIQIGTETAIAEAYSAFQQYAKDLKSRGITLAVSSKNDHANAEEGFLHPDSVLKYKDFTAFKANWEPKFSNILDIAKEINIGIDSLVFVDDNPAEREIVSMQVPMICVPNVGSNISEYICHIDKNGYFETVSLLVDDANRNKYYEDNKTRADEEAKFQDYGSFLDSLNMRAEISTFIPIYMDRITQLINKTNQFNLTTKRYTFGEVEGAANSENYITLYGKLEDKFGDNGLIAIIIAEIKEQMCHIDLWLMSCRVLKRDMEQAMLDALVEECLAKGIYTIRGYYYKSAKNAMVSKLYEKFGFTLLEQSGDDTVWELKISAAYKEQNKHIKRERGLDE